MCLQDQFRNSPLIKDRSDDGLFEGLLSMERGAVLTLAGTTRASDLGRLYKSVSRTTFRCIIGVSG